MNQHLWDKTQPTEEGFYWIRGGIRCIFDSPNPKIVEIYLSAGGLRVRGECCGCRWKDCPTVAELFTMPENPPDYCYEWAGPIFPPKLSENQ